MSIQALSWAIESVHGLPAGPKLVLICLANYAEEHHLAWPSREKIAEISNCSVRSVERHLSVLEEAGLIQATEMRYAASKDSDGKWRKHRAGTVYRLSVTQNMDSVYAGGVIPDNLSVEETSPVDNLGLCRSSQNRQIVGYESPQPTNLVNETPDLSVVLSKEPSINHQPDHTHHLTEGESCGRSGLENDVHDSVPVAPENALSGGSQEGIGVDESDVAVLSQCLPQHWLALDRSGVKEIALLLRERLSRGWTAPQIRSIMTRQFPPEQYSRLAGILRHRLQEHVIPEMAPDMLTRRRTKPPALVQVNDPAEEAWVTTIWGPAWEQAQARTDLTSIEKMRFAQDLVDQSGICKETFLHQWKVLREQKPGVPPWAVTQGVMDRHMRDSP